MTAAMVWREVYRALYWVWIVSEVLILIVTRTRSGGGDVRDRGSLLILWPVITASIVTGSWVGDAQGPTMFSGAHWLRWLALALLVAGLAIRWTAIAALGRSFSANVAIRTGQRLYTGGLFHFVRHPSYSGMLLIFLSLGLATRKWLALAILLVPTTAALLYRIHVEETALNEAFGAEYAAYSRTTKRLIPGLY